MNRTFARIAAVLPLASLVLATSAEAGSFRGRVVLPDGKPAYGAMVSVFNAAGDQRQTVYTEADGSYAIRTPFAGKLKVRARLAGFADAVTEQQAGAASVQQADLALTPFASAEAANESYSASAFNARLPWKDLKRDRPAFVSQCNYCHQVGNSTTRIPRSHEDWLAEVDKMEGMLAMVSKRDRGVIADTLFRGFDGKPIKATQSYGASPELARAKVTEWLVGDGYTFIHDADVARDQKLYGTDEGADILWVLDRTTGKIEKNHLPDINLPRGGLFSGMKLPIGQFTGKHGPHSMAQTSDGRIWITNALSSTLMAFDPVKKTFRTWPVPGDALYPTRSASTAMTWSGSRSSPRTRSAASIRRPNR